MMFFCRRIPLRLLLLPVLAIGFCTVCADQMDLISSSDELINNPEGGSLQYTNPGSWTPTSSEADINDVNIGISPSIMVYKSAGVGVGGPGGPDAGLAENSINAIDNCAKVPKNSRRGVQLRKKRHAPDWCDEKQKPAPFSGHSGGDSDDDGTNISNPTRQAPPKTKPILKPKPAGDTNIQQQQQQPPPTTRSEAEESSIKDLQEVFLRLGGGSICNTELEYFRYRYPVCYPYAMGGKGRPFSVSRATRAARFGLTLESAYLRKDIFPCRPTLIPECYFTEEFWCCEKISQLPDPPQQIERTGKLSIPDMMSVDSITYSSRGTWCVYQSGGTIDKPLPRARPRQQ